MENKVANVGTVVDSVPVRIGPQLLTVFSEQLYSSPNKAFEELVANSWDAGANVVYIGFPVTSVENEQEAEPPSEKSKAIWVLDDGISMDADGLKELWRIAWSGKREKPTIKGRAPIGKFGVGKLATYLLANNIVYICKAADGVIRTVEVDYPQLVKDAPQQLTSEEAQSLDVRSVTDAQLKDILDRFEQGETIYKLVSDGVPQLKYAAFEEEFGGPQPDQPQPSSTWTIVLLTSLKDAGEALQAGRIRWMLRASLPLSPVMAISMNGELLESSKIDEPIETEWVIGPDLGIPSITTKDDIEYAVSELAQPYPSIKIDGIDGPISGRVRLYKERLTGGKSDLAGASHGFFVNILGRVINVRENYFGLDNLSHKTWPKTRITIRADWLDAHLSVSREALTECDEVRAFRALLLQIFNKLRAADDNVQKATWPAAGDILARAFGAVPLQPLTRAIQEALRSEGALPAYVTEIGPGERDAVSDAWATAVSGDPRKAVGDVVIRELQPERPLAIYDPAKLEIQVNQNHPFYREHVGSHEEQTLVRDAAFADVMTYAYMSDVGIRDDELRNIVDYKDDLLRLLAKVRRRTAAQLADLLVKATAHEKGLERALDESFAHLGFIVQPLAQSGEPEGVAIAPLTPDADHNARGYRFTYDAKSTGAAKAKTGNLNVATLQHHRKKYGTEYAIVVAVDFQEGQYVDQCTNAQITPMRANDLGKLLVGMTQRPMDYDAFRGLFELRNADDVAKWVEEYLSKTASGSPLTLAEFLDALAQEEFDGPDPITAESIARTVRKVRASHTKPTAKDVSALVRGLETLIPWFLRVEQDGHLVVSGTPHAIRVAIAEQLRPLPQQLTVSLTVPEHETEA